MSFWSDVTAIEHTVVGWFVKEYAIFYKVEPTLIQVADTTVQYVDIGLPIVLGATGYGSLDPVVQPIVDEIFSDLKVVSSTIYDFGPSPNTVSIVNSVQANLQALDTAGHVKDPASKAKLALIIKSVGALAEAIAAAVAKASGQTPTTAPAA